MGHSSKKKKACFWSAPVSVLIAMHKNLDLAYVQLGNARNCIFSVARTHPEYLPEELGFTRMRMKVVKPCLVTSLQ